MTQPDFWSRPPGVLSNLLSPASAVFRLLGILQSQIAFPDKMEVPVVCIGNVNVGGTGKTPTALAIADRLKHSGMDVHFLTRGYRGRLPGPLRVDLSHHDAGDVGDEPMLLAAHSPTWISKNRAAGAAEAVRDGANIIIMDDGFQNPHIQKDLSVVVIDGESGFGNGRVMPAGPLREPVMRGLGRADLA
ncbi:MAG: tetraacyldisaccharide 4'-kinase, partial [Pseudomonadota bacterium]